LAIQNSHNPKMFARFRGKTIIIWAPFKAAAIEFGKEMGALSYVSGLTFLSMCY